MKRLLLKVCLAAWASCSYSNPYTYGTSNNAALEAHKWSMSASMLGVPDTTGMDINAVIYQYRAEKDTASDMVVSIQNKSTESGYIFRETDDWSGLPGNTIVKAVPVPNIPINLWGDGEIEIKGEGKVVDPVVIYNWRQRDVEPEPYIPEIPQVEIYDAMSDDVALGALEPTDSDLYEDNDENTDADKDEEEPREEEENRLSQAQDAMATAMQASQQTALQALVNTVNLTQYYSVAIVGGTYKETVQINDSEMPYSKRGLRNGLAQQLLHTQMVDMQYNRKNK